ncbi:MAG: hypothetical protein WD176_05410 [Pirellulales bacterium]
MSRFYRTTLVAPAFWAAVAVAAVVAVELCVWLQRSPDGRPPDWAPAARFVAAVGTLCPHVAVLGAKRPQNRAWQWIVGSLWLVASLPALRALLFQGGRAVEVHVTQSSFLIILVAVCALNWLPTRYWLSSLLVAAGQILLLAPHLSLVDQNQTDRSILAAVGLFALAAVLVAAGIGARRQTDHPLDALWINFRDQFGVLWAWRVLARLNATAAQCQWPVRLTWNGFTPPPKQLSAEVERSVLRSMRSMLRRFVDSESLAD